MNYRRFFDFHGPRSVFDLSEMIGGQIHKDQLSDAKSTLIYDVKNIEDSGEGDLAFIDNIKYEGLLKDAKCSCCLVQTKIDVVNNSTILIKVDDPYFSYSKILKILFSEKNNTSDSPVSKKAIIGERVFIGHNVVIEDGVAIGDDSYIDHNSCIKQNVKIGKNVKIGAGSYISFAEIGDNAIIHPGAKIGTDGFGFATHSAIHQKIIHIGSVRIGNGTEIGACTTIDRGSVRDTIIGDNVMIDNLVQIAHNVRIGSGSIIVAQVGIAGSTIIGNYVAVGGQAGIAGHLNIGNFAQIAAKSGVMTNIQDGEKVGGMPSMPIKEWHKQTIMLKKMLKNPAYQTS
ncbi:MAG: UDP-3-O-(3-hydroxymyristoyl)glucosamine N-acyltransferase [Rickettsiaceae bacterium]|nr:UDP-3-O-(3-hydroxymyristoyl)glucosamine N-acyltransferase [Rickettsiaceae bacterium]